MSMNTFILVFADGYWSFNFLISTRNHFLTRATGGEPPRLSPFLVINFRLGPTWKADFDESLSFQTGVNVLYGKLLKTVNEVLMWDDIRF